MHITGKDTHVCLYANDEFFRIYQVSREIIGKNFYDYVPVLENHLEEPYPDWEKQRLL